MAGLVAFDAATPSCTACKDPVADRATDGGDRGCGSQSSQADVVELARMEARLRGDGAASPSETEVTLPPEEARQLSARQRGRETGATSVTGATGAVAATQKLGKCERCGYMSSQAICQACKLLQGLNKNRPQVQI